MAAHSPAPFAVRGYRRGDFAVMHEIDRLCFPEYMAYSRAELAFYLGHPAAITRVADVEGGILGFVVGWIESAAQAHVITLDVIPEARRQGVGSRLMEVLHEEIGSRGIKEVTLEVAVVNEGAQRFYESLRYRRTGLLRHYYKAQCDAYRMSVRL